jgi:hypothetical protein
MDWAADPRVTFAERDEGQYWAYLGSEMDGPYPDAEAARAGLPPTNPARGDWCGCGLYGDHDETHGDRPHPDEMPDPWEQGEGSTIPAAAGYTVLSPGGKAVNVETDEDLHRELGTVAGDLAEVLERREGLIRMARERGWPLRRTGPAVGLSHGAVAKILASGAAR